MPLAANEFLVWVIDCLDRLGWGYFTSLDIALHLNGPPLKYVQKTLSRLRKRGLLTCAKLPRTVAGGYKRGTFNLYCVKPNGVARAEWWRKSNSRLGFEYLAVGRGNLDEMPRCDLAQSAAALIFSEPDRLKVRSRDPNCLAALLTCQNQRSMLGYMISDRDNPLLPLVLTLKSEGIIPDQVISNPGIFLTLAKHGYHCSDTQTLVGALGRSARYWKSRYETLEKALEEETSSRVNKQGKKDLIDVCKSLMKLLESCEKEGELKLMKASVKIFSLENQVEILQRLASTNVEIFIHIIKELEKISDPYLEPIKWWVTTKLRALGGVNIIFSSNNSLLSSGVA